MKRNWCRVYGERERARHTERESHPEQFERHLFQVWRAQGYDAQGSGRKNSSRPESAVSI